MKKLFLLSGLLLAFIALVQAQNKTLGVGIASPNTNAALHVESPTNNQGMLMPRLTTIQRTAMSLSASDIGMQVYDTDLKGLYAWDGAGWRNGGLVLPIVASTSAAAHAVDVTHTGTGGSTGFFRINNTASLGNAIYATTNTSNDRGAIYGESTGTGGTAGIFKVLSATNPYAGVYGETAGTGTAGLFKVINASNALSAVYGETNGTGSAGYFKIINAANNFSGVTGESNGTGNAVFGVMTGTGRAGQFQISNAVNTNIALRGATIGLGPASRMTVNNAANTEPGLWAETNGTGPGVRGESTGTGSAGYFLISNTANSQFALHAQTDGTGSAGYFKTTNTSTSSPAVFGTTNSNIGGTSSPMGVYGESTGTGSIGGAFMIKNTGNIWPALYSESNGTGPAFAANQIGVSGNIAEFLTAGSRIARIDKTGKGFFNGGTQSSGADVAELFDVEGDQTNYEPGDVLVISESTDRTVEKSSEANSTKVAGVYATKPGVILTEKDVDESTDDLVPMGVIGVIPTKVCLENGAIRRGDLLVTSSKAGHAMKAVPQIVNGISIYPTGAMLGKALENFDGNGNGLIKVLVNVK